MGSGVGKVYDEHREYLGLCNAMGEEPVGGLPLASAREWSAHFERLKKEAFCSCGGGRLHTPQCPEYWT